MLEVLFEDRWLRAEVGLIGQVRLYVDRKLVAKKLDWFGAKDMPRLYAELDDGSTVEVYSKTDEADYRSRLAISVDGQTIART